MVVAAILKVPSLANVPTVTLSLLMGRAVETSMNAAK